MKKFNTFSEFVDALNDCNHDREKQEKLFFVYYSDPKEAAKEWLRFSGCIATCDLLKKMKRDTSN